jgi:hypothetical protein
MTYARAIENVYEGGEDLKGYKFIARNGNVNVYQKKGARLFAIRGMRPSDATDRSAVLSLLTNDLKNSARYKKDKEFIMKHKTLGVKVITVGHSLGGAIVDQLIDDGVITRGLSFNPAIQPKDLFKTANRRLYNKDDFLYLLIGKYSGNHGLIDLDFKAFEGSWLEVLFKLWTAHKIEQFVENKTDEPRMEEGTAGTRKEVESDSESDKEEKPMLMKKKKPSAPKPSAPKPSAPKINVGRGIVQSVVIKKEAYPDIDDARVWVRSHGYKVSKVDETPNTFRFRQLDPNIMKTGKYVDRMIDLDNGIGYLNMLYED